MRRLTSDHRLLALVHGLAQGSHGGPDFRGGIEVIAVDGRSWTATDGR